MTMSATETRYIMDIENGHIVPEVDASEIKQWDSDYVLGTYVRQPGTFVRGRGIRVWDADGKEYLDFLAGLAVTSVGHCHPKVVAAMQEQAATLVHMSNLYLTAPQAQLAKKLIEISDFDRVFFCNSGAEANEAAIKIARKHGKKTSDNKFEIVTAHRSFHGRTLATVTATAQPKYQDPFRPVVAGFHYVPLNDIAALELAVNENTCAVMLEPVQGEAGIYPAQAEYLAAARAICDKHGALLIFDEVQTGVGRSGKWWAYQHSGVVPDVMTLAKGLGGGIPIGACLTRGASASTLVPGDHGTTFGGTPFATRTALAVLETIEEEHLVENAHAMGHYFVQRLQDPALLSKIKEIRSLGLLLGVELIAPDAKRVQSEALKNGLILNAVGNNILRFLPPLIIAKADIDQAIEILKAVV